MRMTQSALRYGQKRVVKKLVRSVPWIGAIAVAATVAQTMRRKGAFAGAIDSALDAIPFLGGAKSLAEVIRGRDFIPERTTRALQ